MAKTDKELIEMLKEVNGLLHKIPYFTYPSIEAHEKDEARLVQLESEIAALEAGQPQSGPTVSKMEIVQTPQIEPDRDEFIKFLEWADNDWMDAPPERQWDDMFNEYFKIKRSKEKGKT